jgi:hypothetical protein
MWDKIFKIERRNGHDGGVHILWFRAERLRRLI